jgi:hypothetical protein
MAVRRNTPLVIPPNTVDPDLLVTFNPVNVVVTNYFSFGFVGGVVPKTASNFPTRTSVLQQVPVLADQMPFIFGWPGQVTYLIPPSVVGPMPARPMNGTSYSNFSFVFEPIEYFGKKGTPFRLPKAVFSDETFSTRRAGGGTGTDYVTHLADPAIYGPLNAAGISLLMYGGTTNDGSFCPILEPFAAADGLVDAGIFINPTLYPSPPFPFPPPLGVNYSDYTIDPTTFMGGQMLTFTWHGNFMPYTYYYNAVGNTQTIFMGNVLNFQLDTGIAGPGGLNFFLYTDVLTGLVDNEIAQVELGIGNFEKYRHVFVIDVNGWLITPPLGSLGFNISDYPGYNSVLSMLSEPWMKVVMADLSNPASAAAVIAAEAADFFS